MPGSPFQKRKYGKVAVRIGCHVHVEMVAEKTGDVVGAKAVNDDKLLMMMKNESELTRLRENAKMKIEKYA